MSFQVFINVEKDNLVEKISFSNEKEVHLSNQMNYNEILDDFIGENFVINYSDGRSECAKLISVGFEEEKPYFTYDLLDDRKGDLENE
jgi:hypothetical protein